MCIESAIMRRLKQPMTARCCKIKKASLIGGFALPSVIIPDLNRLLLIMTYKSEGTLWQMGGKSPTLSPES